MEEQDNWTMTSAWLDLWAGNNHTCEYVQDYFEARNHILHDKEITEQLKWRGMTVKLDNKRRREQER